MGNNKNYGWQNKKELNETRTEQARQAMQTIGDATPMEDKLVGTSGGLGLVTGTSLKLATTALSSIYKAATGSGLKMISNVLGRGKTAASTSKKVPIIGSPGKTATVSKSSTTQQVSYANPKISMTAAERAKAGY